MATSATGTTSLNQYAGLLKQLYRNRKIEVMTVGKDPFLAKVKKHSDFVGSSEKVPIAVGFSPNASHDDEVAFANTGTSSSDAFLVTRVSTYDKADLDIETVMAAKSNPGAFKSHFKHEMDSAIEGHRRLIESGLFRQKNGVRGRIQSLSNSNKTLTLTDRMDTHCFWAGQKIGLSADPGTGSLRGTPSYATISSVDTSAGTITVSADITSTISGAAANDYIFIKGGHATGIAGVADWVVDSTASLSTAFYGVTRSSYDSRVGGMRLDASSNPGELEEILIDAVAKAGEHGAYPDAIYLSWSNWAKLTKSMNSSRIHESKVLDGLVGFQSVSVQGRDVFPSTNVPNDRIYLLEMEDWEFNTLGGFPIIGKAEELEDYDVQRIKVKSYGNLICRRPWNQLVVLL